MQESAVAFPNFPLPQTVGIYQVNRVLSKDGNMSRIFEAFNPDGQRVALKIARADDPTFNNLLSQEIGVLEKIRHPGVVHIYPIRFPNNPHVGYRARASSLEPYFGGKKPWYYVMEFLNGGSLEDNFAHGNGPIAHFPNAWKMELVYRIGLALHHIHSRKTAHLDVNMKNVVFRTKPDPRTLPDPVLIDFGLTEQYDKEPLANAGTLAYASPDRVERLRSIRAKYLTTTAPRDQFDHRAADVWSLGVIAYELLTGKSPFDPIRDEDELARNILHKPIPSTGDLRMDTLLIGDPATTDDKQNRRNGMLSKVREHRLPIMDVLSMLDVYSPYPPPRVTL